MDLKVGCYYKLKINLYGRIEEYEGKVLSLSENEFRFETDDDNACRALTLIKSEVIKFSKIDYLKRKKNIHKISNKKKFKNLKESVKPEF